MTRTLIIVNKETREQKTVEVTQAIVDACDLTSLTVDLAELNALKHPRVVAEEEDDAEETMTIEVAPYYYVNIGEVLTALFEDPATVFDKAIKSIPGVDDAEIPNYIPACRWIETMSLCGVTEALINSFAREHERRVKETAGSDIIKMFALFRLAPKGTINDGKPGYKTIDLEKIRAENNEWLFDKLPTN
jgi:hypothetical protein